MSDVFLVRDKELPHNAWLCMWEENPRLARPLQYARIEYMPLELQKELALRDRPATGKEEKKS